MFEDFEKTFPRDEGRTAARTMTDANSVPEIGALRQFMTKFGGASFCNGLYRVVEPRSISQWLDRVSLAFPDFRTTVTCFGYDWLGRVFALDTAQSEQGQPSVVMFEPGTGEALDIPSNLETFHNRELQRHGEAALAISFYNKWLQSGGAAPRHYQCIGYKVPLFLGGIDDIGNLSLDDIAVYWHISAQIIQKARGLPAGTRIDRTSIG